MRKRKGKRKAVDVTLPQDLIEQLDKLASELDATRSYVVQTLLEYAFQDVDAIFPYEKKEESEEDIEEESEEEEEEEDTED